MTSSVTFRHISITGTTTQLRLCFQLVLLSRVGSIFYLLIRYFVLPYSMTIRITFISVLVMTYPMFVMPIMKKKSGLSLSLTLRFLYMWDHLTMAPMAHVRASWYAIVVPYKRSCKHICLTHPRMLIFLCYILIARYVACDEICLHL